MDKLYFCVMIIRNKQSDLLDSLSYFPSVGIVGPRQCGKTTLARQLINAMDKHVIYLDLESSRDLSILNEAELFFDQHINDCIILDEVQVKPDLFPLLRSSIDKNRIPARFILLGSSSPKLLRQSNESLAGRISYHELAPFHLSEIDEQQKHFLRGGYPESYLQQKEKMAFEWLNNYIQSYVDRDFAALGLKASPSTLYKLWRMLAHIHGNILNTEQLSRSLGISATSIRNYIDFMEEAFLIRRLPSFHINIKKRLVKAPKIYIRDSGILHALMSISTFSDLEFHPSIGASWEGYVIEQIAQALPDTKEVHYYRTHQGSEVDLVITKGLQPIASVEIKYSAAPKVTKSLAISIEDLQTTRNFVIVPEEQDYLLRKDIRVTGLRKFLSETVSSLE